jgi:drug/metabolite transporter (DMT)-like permease
MAGRSRDGVLFLLLGLIWGSVYLAIKVGGEGLAPFTFVAVRLAIGAAFLLLLLRLRGDRLPPRAVLGHVGVVGLTGVAIPFTLTTWGQHGADAGLASIFNAATPLFTVVLAGLVLSDEPLRAGRLAGILVGFAGIVAVVGGGVEGGGSPASIVAMLLSVSSYAITAVYTRRFLRGVPTISLAAGQVLVGLAATAPIAFVFEGSTAVLPPPETIQALLWLGIVASGIAPLLYFHLVGSWGAARTSVVYYLIPIVGVSAGAILLGEEVGPMTVAGALLVIAGVAIATKSSAARVGAEPGPVPLPVPAAAAP